MGKELRGKEDTVGWWVYFGLLMPEHWRWWLTEPNINLSNGVVDRSSRSRYVLITFPASHSNYRHILHLRRLRTPTAWASPFPPY